MKEDFDDYDNFEDSLTFNPQRFESDTFEKRNDPKTLLNRFRLDLLNCFEVQKKILNTESQQYETIIKIKQRKGTKPKANKQGIADIISYMEKFINSHTVQGNIPSEIEFKIKMRFISDDITMHFITNRKKWEITLEDVDILVSNAVNLVELFLSRTLFNEERKGYGESYKETTNKEIKTAEKPNSLQKVANFLIRR